VELGLFAGDAHQHGQGGLLEPPALQQLDILNIFIILHIFISIIHSVFVILDDSLHPSYGLFVVPYSVRHQPIVGFFPGPLIILVTHFN